MTNWILKTIGMSHVSLKIWRLDEERESRLRGKNFSINTAVTSQEEK